MSNDAPIHECESELEALHRAIRAYSLRRVFGFFNVPQIFYDMSKGFWNGAYGLSSLFLCFWVLIVIYDNEFKTKESKI